MSNQSDSQTFATKDAVQKCQCGHTPEQHYLGSLSCNVETCICFLYLEVGEA